MKRFSLLTATMLSVALAACQSQSEPPAEEQTPEPAQPELLAAANLNLADGSDAGSAELTAADDVVTVSVTLANLSEGVHAVHLHTTGMCEGPDFSSAGGHLNPSDNEHGTENPNGSHLGDLPNATVDANGTGTLSVELNGTREDVLAAIFDEDGTAIVVHEGEDDYMTDPAGDAGGRVACGVLADAAS